MSPSLPPLRGGWIAVGSAVLAFAAAFPAGAHGGSEDLVRPVLTRIRPAIPGVEVKVVYSAAFQLLVENTTSTDFTVIATTGEPFLRIGPDGVLANINSPSWYDSNTFEGLARPGAEVEPQWAVSRLNRTRPCKASTEHVPSSIRRNLTSWPGKERSVSSPGQT